MQCLLDKLVFSVSVYRKHIYKVERRRVKRQATAEAKNFKCKIKDEDGKHILSCIRATAPLSY